MAVAIGVHTLGLGVSASGVIGFFAALLAGLGKEAYDVWDDMAWYSFSLKDLLADVIGGVLATAIYLIINRTGWDFDEFFRFAFGLTFVCIAIAVISYSVIGVLIQRKALLYPKYRKEWWKWWKHKEE